MTYYDVEDLAGHGKKPNQRMKHFLVLQYLMRETDNEHFAKTEDRRNEINLNSYTFKHKYRKA